jgi:hypothetical protein
MTIERRTVLWKETKKLRPSRNKTDTILPFLHVGNQNDEQKLGIKIVPQELELPFK